MLNSRQLIEHKLSPEIIELLDFWDSEEYATLSDNIFRYCSEEEKQNILKECDIV